MNPIALISTRRGYESLSVIYVPIAAGVFAIVAVALLGSVLRYRRRVSGARWSDRNLVEGGYAVFLMVVVAFLLYLTHSAGHKMDTLAAHERPRVTIGVTAADPKPRRADARRQARVVVRRTDAGLRVPSPGSRTPVSRSSACAQCQLSTVTAPARGGG